MKKDKKGTACGNREASDQVVKGAVYSNGEAGKK